MRIRLVEFKNLRFSLHASVSDFDSIFNLMKNDQMDLGYFSARVLSNFMSSDIVRFHTFQENSPSQATATPLLCFSGFFILYH